MHDIMNRGLTTSGGQQREERCGRAVVPMIPEEDEGGKDLATRYLWMCITCAYAVCTNCTGTGYLPVLNTVP